MRSRRLPVLALLFSLAAGCASASPSTSGSQARSGGQGPGSGADGHVGLPPGSEGSEPTGEGWEKIREEDGIVVHKKEVEGSPLVAFRGAGVVDAPISKVVFVLIDLSRTKEWVERVVDAKIVRQISESEYVTYTHLGAPIIVSDREFVSRATISVGPGRMVRFTMNATEDPDVPHGKYVRGELINSSWEVRPLDATHTHVAAEIHADPKGALPKMIVNFLQTSWAYKTITALRRQAARDDLTENPLMLARLKEHHLVE
jgi:hypothetical protein